jgi:dihydroneopterin aldolase/2-amino-4-hydroxy-6-hydroxymethyldihydropteridine diphosphokinase
MTDEIRIRGLRIYAYHGVFPEENQKGQPFVVNVTLHTDTRRAGRTDELIHSTNYGEVCQTIGDVLSHTHRLIETVAEEVARTILLTYPLVGTVDVEIEKPQAPIPMDFDTVSVAIHRGWTKAYVALGSNLGDKAGYLNGAVAGLKADPNIRVKRTSSWIVTEPYGGVEQDVFLNGAVEIETLYSPEELLDVLHRLEQEANRVRKIHWGPRTLDLDILFFGTEIRSDPELTIPHGDLQNRDFVLRPMAEIAPGLVHPVCRKTMAQLLADWEAAHPCS